jgi:hypothetical protein
LTLVYQRDLLIISASISAHGVVEKHKGIVIRVVVIIASCPLPDVGHPLYSGSDNGGLPIFQTLPAVHASIISSSSLSNDGALLPLD